MARWDASRRRVATTVAAAALVVAGVSLAAWFGSTNQAGPHWTVGDFWTFTTSGLDFRATLTYQVREQLTLSTSIGSVPVWRLEATYTQLSASGTPVSQPFTDEYYLTLDLGLVRVDREVPPYRILYVQPNGSWPFPLNPASSWSGSVRVTYWWTPDGSSQQNTTTPFDFRVVGDGVVSVPAGTFRALGASGDFLALWRGGYVAQYSDSVGYVVRDDLTDGNGSVVGYYVLTSYRYQAGTSTRILILVGAVAIDAGAVGAAVYILLRKRKTKPQQPAGGNPSRPGEGAE